MPSQGPRAIPTGSAGGPGGAGRGCSTGSCRGAPGAPGATAGMLQRAGPSTADEIFGKQSLSFQQLMKPDREKCELRPTGKGNLLLPSPPPASPARMTPFLTGPPASLTSWENICADGQGERLESGAFAANLKYAGNASRQQVYPFPARGQHLPGGCARRRRCCWAAR